MLLLANVHPGEILREEFMRPRGLGVRRLALESGIPLSQLQAVLRCRQRIDAEMAIRLAEQFGLRERFWLGLQMDFDLEEAFRCRAGPFRSGVG
jgi:addiction module HigA family antidote